MKITWLGQAGLLFDNGNIKIMIDPYLSNSVEGINPLNFRRQPINDDIFKIEPDVMIFTHDHLDHYDPETAEIFLGTERTKKTVLSPTSVWQRARALGGGHNYVMFNRHTEWTEGGVRFTAVKAEHSDPLAIGVLIEDIEAQKTYYVAGDTLYNDEIFGDLKKDIDLAFLPVNGVGNNMNVTDATRFFKRCGAKRAAPYHVGMFDSLSPEIFDDKNKITLKIYEETEI